MIAVAGYSERGYPVVPLIRLQDVVPDAVLVTRHYPLNSYRPSNEVTAMSLTETRTLRRAGDIFDEFSSMPHGERLMLPPSESSGDLFIDNMYPGMRESLTALAEAMPSAVNITETTMALGSAVLASRRMTREDCEMQDKRESEASRAKYETDKAAVDKGKTSILDQDHARISVDNVALGKDPQHYFLPLDRGNAILAARVIDALATVSKDAPSTTADYITELVWSTMPTAEREMFLGAKHKVLNPTGRFLKPNVLEVMRSLTNTIGITRETTGERFKLVGEPQINLHAEAPASSDIQDYAPIFPPGTDRDKITLPSDDTISEQALQRAEVLISLVNSPVPLGQDQALAVLDLITDPDIKRAIRRSPLTSSEQRPSDILNALHQQVRDTLADAYYEAWRIRMVNGNSSIKSGRQVRLTSGGLPITTNPARFVTKKWRVGSKNSA